MEPSKYCHQTFRKSLTCLVSVFLCHLENQHLSLNTFFQSQTEKLAKVYQPKRSVLSPKSTISVAHLLAARQDLSKILRTSSGSIREKTACAINKVTRLPLIFFQTHLFIFLKYSNLKFKISSSYRFQKYIIPKHKHNFINIFINTKKNVILKKKIKKYSAWNIKYVFIVLRRNCIKVPFSLLTTPKKNGSSGTWKAGAILVKYSYARRKKN